MATQKQPARLSRKDRLRILELAATGYYDSPKDAVARATAYVAFLSEEAPKPPQPGRKRPASKPRKPLMTRPKTR